MASPPRAPRADCRGGGHWIPPKPRRPSSSSRTGCRLPTRHDSSGSGARRCTGRWQPPGCAAAGEPVLGPSSLANSRFHPVPALPDLAWLRVSGAELRRARLTDLVDAQVTITDTEGRPGRSPLKEMRGQKVTIKGALIDPHLLYVNKARIEHVFGIAVLHAAFSARLASAIRCMAGRAASILCAGRRTVPTINNMPGAYRGC